MINRVGFVLIKPQLPENIGFCARALKNFGFKKLDLVDPKEKLPNRKAIAMTFLRKQKFILTSSLLLMATILFMLPLQEKETSTKNIFHLENLLKV